MCAVGVASPSLGMGKLQVVWSPAYEVDIGRHVFPTAKYRLVRGRLLAGGVIDAADVVVPTAATFDDLARIHTAGYLDKIRRDAFTPQERYDLEIPFTGAVADASRLCCGGTLLTARLALRDGVAVHLGGGFHHAFADHGEGFCLLNDVAFAARTLLDEGAVGRVLIVDLDVHHGNGTASIFATERRVYTLSMHQEWNYPALKPTSDLDFGLPDGILDGPYLEILEATLERALERAEPGLALYLAGADPYREDLLGGLALTREGLRRRDAYVLDTLTGRGVPVAVTLAGGYAADPDDTIAIHVATVVEARRALEAMRPLRDRGGAA